ncbi:MAG: Gfo/Idh/MocA family oxidoreductase [Rhodothermales bacterium]
MDSLNWGLLSTARINRSLIPAIRASTRSCLLGVASRSLAKAQAYADAQGIAQAYGSYDALLADPDIHVIYNALPNHLHAKWTIKAVEAGKHVLCEKPIALTTADVMAIEDAARANDRVVTEGFMYRHHARTKQVQQLITDGILGQLTLVKGAFTYTIADVHKIRLDPNMGGGSLWDVGCYPVSFARMITGEEPEAVQAFQVLGKTGVDLSFTGQMRFPGGVLAQFDCGFQAPFRMEMELVGTEGRMVLPKAFKPGEDTPILIYRGDDAPEAIDVPGNLLYLDEVDDLVAAVLDGRPPLLSLAESRTNVEAITRLYAAAA